MGCTDRESNFQYEYYRPEDGQWRCTWGYLPTYAAPRGYENELTLHIKKQLYLPHIRFKARFNAAKQMWEVHPILDGR